MTFSNFLSVTVSVSQCRSVIVSQCRSVIVLQCHDTRKSNIYTFSFQTSFLQVLPSDTLNNISLRYNVSVAELKKVNNIWSDQDFYGLKRIKVPAFGGAPVLNQPSAPSMDIDQILFLDKTLSFQNIICSLYLWAQKH